MRTTLALAGVLLLAGCTGEPVEEEPPPAPTTPPTAEPAPDGPEEGACYRLRFAQAIAPTSAARPVSCERPHTTETYATGTLDTVVDGHLVAVDSERVQQQVAATCPEQLAEFVGGDPDDLRLSMLRPVWFTPTVEQSDEGANWYRCDAVVVAGADSLAELDVPIGGILDQQQGREFFAMCGTAAPDQPAFERVQCSSEHTWRAVEVVTFEAVQYPGEQAARERGQVQCENAGLDAAGGALDFKWGYEWPTEEQWAMGQTYGRCWAPD